MIYLFIIVLVGITFLILQKQKSIQVKKNSNEMQLVACAKCGIYTPQNECQIKHGKFYCNECKD